MQLRNLDFLLDKCKSAPRMTLAVACPQGDDILEAVADAASEGIVNPVLVGNRSKTLAIAGNLGLDISRIPFIDEPDDSRAAEKAVRMVSSGEAHLLMKGNVKTAILLKAVLNKEWGLRSGSLLSHLFLFKVPLMPGVIGMSDGGMAMYPDLPTKVGIVENAVAAYHKIGVACPKIAALAAVELVNPDMPATLDAAALAQMNRRGQIKGCILDGPLALDNAVSEEAARIKGIDSPVAGHADMLLVPSIEAGNFVGKVMMYMSGGKGAGVILGARKPIVLTSRFDNAETKLLSIAFGAVLAMS
jgi:phosphate butyryltransferase